MAYDSDTLDVFVDTIGGSRRLLTYQTTDTKATVLGLGYFSDLRARGGQVNDLMVIISGDGAFVAQVTEISTAGAGTVATTYEDEMLALQSYVDTAVTGVAADVIASFEVVPYTAHTTYTPTVVFATPGATPAAITYSRQQGGYELVGTGLRLWINLEFTITALNDSTGILRIPLPSGYIADADAESHLGVTLKSDDITYPTGATQMWARPAPDTSYLELWGTGSASGSIALTHPLFATATPITLRLSGRVQL